MNEIYLIYELFSLSQPVHVKVYQDFREEQGMQIPTLTATVQHKIEEKTRTIVAYTKGVGFLERVHYLWACFGFFDRNSLQLG